MNGQLLVTGVIKGMILREEKNKSWLHFLAPGKTIATGELKVGATSDAHLHCPLPLPQPAEFDVLIEHLHHG